MNDMFLKSNKEVQKHIIINNINNKSVQNRFYYSHCMDNIFSFKRENSDKNLVLYINLIDIENLERRIIRELKKTRNFVFVCEKDKEFYEFIDGIERDVGEYEEAESKMLNQYYLNINRNINFKSIEKFCNRYYLYDVSKRYFEKDNSKYQLL